MMNTSWHSVVIILAVFSLNIQTEAEASKCETCRKIVEKFKEGLENTAKSNFGGGNTNWEEKNLGSFANSETRFLEVLEHSCEDSSRECHYMVEEHEEVLEKWFFLQYARGLNEDLFEYFCISNLKVCCPSGTFGPSCSDCPGGRDRPCFGNGNCKGDGTREGKGTCSCNVGYSGSLCSNCTDGYFEESRNETHVECRVCHQACNVSCSGPERTHCNGCKSGWLADEAEGCKDVNECESSENGPLCTESQFCSNSEGSYSCIGCHSACNGCTGSEPENCKACAARYFLKDGVCTSCHESCASACTDETAATCDSCAEGWRLGEDNQCHDVNECAEQIRVCEGNSFCINTEGSSTCSSCHQSCDGCSGPTSSDCVQCKVGYSLNADGQCTDIDECIADTKPCDADSEKCVNTIGSYRCECAHGFMRKNNKCEPKKKPSSKNKQKPKKKQEEKNDSDKPLTDGLGSPLKGVPLDKEEMVVIEGKFSNPTQAQENVSPEVTSPSDSTENSRHEL